MTAQRRYPDPTTGRCRRRSCATCRWRGRTPRLAPQCPAPMPSAVAHDQQLRSGPGDLEVGARAARSAAPRWSATSRCRGERRDGAERRHPLARRRRRAPRSRSGRADQEHLRTRPDGFDGGDHRRIREDVVRHRRPRSGHGRDDRVDLLVAVAAGADQQLADHAQDGEHRRGDGEQRQPRSARRVDRIERNRRQVRHRPLAAAARPDPPGASEPSIQVPWRRSSPVTSSGSGIGLHLQQVPQPGQAPVEVVAHGRHRDVEDAGGVGEAPAEALDQVHRPGAASRSARPAPAGASARTPGSSCGGLGEEARAPRSAHRGPASDRVGKVASIGFSMAATRSQFSQAWIRAARWRRRRWRRRVRRWARRPGAAPAGAAGARTRRTSPLDPLATPSSRAHPSKGGGAPMCHTWSDRIGADNRTPPHHPPPPLPPPPPPPPPPPLPPPPPPPPPPDHDQEIGGLAVNGAGEVMGAVSAVGSSSSPWSAAPGAGGEDGIRAEAPPPAPGNFHHRERPTGSTRQVGAADNGEEPTVKRGRLLVRGGARPRVARRGVRLGTRRRSRVAARPRRRAAPHRPAPMPRRRPARRHRRDHGQAPVRRRDLEPARHRRRDRRDLLRAERRRMSFTGSTRKLFSVGLALDTLGAEPARRRRCTGRARSTPTARSTGDLVLVGGGDLTFGGRRIDADTIEFTDFDHNDANRLGTAILTPQDPLYARRRPGPAGQGLGHHLGQRRRRRSTTACSSPTGCPTATC